MKKERRSQSGGTRPMLSRIYFIDRKIASGTYPSTRQLAEEYEVGTATISRDIEFLRDRIGAPVEYDSHHRGYFYSDKSYRLPASFSRPEDMLALRMVKNLNTLYRGTPLYPASRELLDSITAPLAVNGRSEKPWYEDRIIVPPVAAAPVSTHVWDTITATAGLIALYEEAVPWAMDRQWAADQRIETKDGQCILSFSSAQLNKVLEWALSQGCAAKPLEPEELVDAWKNNVREMGKMAD